MESKSNVAGQAAIIARGSAALIFSVLMSLPGTLRAQGCPVQPGDFVRTKVVGNEVNEPMELEIDAEDNVYWIERKTGNLRIFDAKAKAVVKSATLKTYMNGTGSNQSNSVGLIGLALAPDFAASRKLYLNYSPEPQGGKQKLRVSRFTLGADKVLDMASEEIIMEWEASFTCCHQGGSLEFGPGGILHIGTGDNWNTDAADPASWAVPYNVSMNPQNQNGKILRILPKGNGGGYTVPDGNLFKTPEEGRPEIYVMGVRNAYRIQADPRTGWVYWGDIGPDGPRMEEINQARNAPGNYGWPAFIGENEATPGNGGWNAIKDQRPAPKVPLISYNGTTDKVHTGAAATAGMNIRGRAGWAGPIYYYDGRSASRSKFPPSHHGTLMVYDWHMGWIRTVRFTDDGYVKSADAFTSYTWVHMIDMKYSPNGELYVLDYGATYRQNNGDDGLYKISYNPPDPAACLPAAPELDSRTIGNAKPVAVGPPAGRRTTGPAFTVRTLQGRAWLAIASGSAEVRGGGRITVRDLEGRTLATTAFSGGDPGPFPLPMLEAGLRLVELTTASGTRVEKAYIP